MKKEVEIALARVDRYGGKVGMGLTCEAITLAAAFREARAELAALAIDPEGRENLCQDNAMLRNDLEVAKRDMAALKAELDDARSCMGELLAVCREHYDNYMKAAHNRCDEHFQKALAKGEPKMRIGMELISTIRLNALKNKFLSAACDCARKDAEIIRLKKEIKRLQGE